MPETQDPLRAAVMRAFNDIHRGTARLIEMAPVERYDWRPAEGMFTLRELVAHVAQIPAMGVRGLLSDGWQQPDVPQDLDPARARALHEKACREVHDGLDGLSDAVFAKRLVRMPWGPEMPLGRAVLILLEHDIHHRTQLFLYLKQLGMDVNTMTLFA